MNSRIFLKVQRPRESDLKTSGALVCIVDDNLEWMGRVVEKYKSEEKLSEMLKNNPPNVTGIKVLKSTGELIALIVVTKGKDDGTYRIEYYRENDKKIIFCAFMNMITKQCTVVTSKVSGGMVSKIANLVTTVMYFLYITKYEGDGETRIIPFTVFGKELYED